MKYIFYTNIISPHQLPWCCEFAKLVGEKNFLYIVEEELHEERKTLGWGDDCKEWIRHLHDSSEALYNELEMCDILITSLRKTELLKKRAAAGLRSYYMFERWFKPPLGAWRMFHPGYYKMCKEFKMLSADPSIRLLPIGIYGASDIVKMQAALTNPFILLERSHPKDISAGSPMEKCGPDMRLWGYFVTPAAEDRRESSPEELSIFWCGRMLDWKRVDTLVKAAKFLLTKEIPLTLTLVGQGPEEFRLRKTAGKWLDDKIFFHPPAKIEEIRRYMQKNDVYVLASDGGEGWGAALNEAMAEGMIPVGTYEAGSSATMIEHGKNGFLYHSKNVKELGCILEQIWKLKQSCKDQEIRQNALETIRNIWSPVNAASRLLTDCEEWMADK